MRLARYQEISKILEQQIRKETLKSGDKLPSIRMISREHGVSISTAQAAFYELEAKSMIAAKPQSGYYVIYNAPNKLALPQKSQPLPIAGKAVVEGIYENLLSNDHKADFTIFSRGVPSAAHLPIAKLHKGMIQALKDLPAAGSNYEPLKGNELLIKQIARWSFNWKGNLNEDEIITAGGCIGAISLCLRALTKAGDTVAVESPCFYGVLNLAKSMHLNVVELPTHPETGLDLQVLEQTLKTQNLAACLIVSNFSNPFGCLMPEAHKQRIVELITTYEVPLIEDDLYGDLYFGTQRPVCCKSFDKEGLVLLCSSVSKTLAPGYRVGWVAAGRFKEAILKQKLYSQISLPALPSEVIAQFLANGRYETHLRKLRKVIFNNYLRYAAVIAEAFPAGTKMSRPQGGLSLWVELPAAIDTLNLYKKAIQHKITFSPGRMFTLQDQFQNGLRLSLGLEWNEKVEERLRILGGLVGTSTTQHAEKWRKE